VSAGAFVWVVSSLLLLAIQVLTPQQSGPLALTVVLEPYILLTAWIASPLAVRSRYAARFVVLALAIATGARYGDQMVSLPSHPVGQEIRVATWNMELGVDEAARAAEGFVNSEAQIVGVEELRPDAATALAQDPDIAAATPFHVFKPSPGIGLGLLSAYPIVDSVAGTDPPFLRAVVALPDGALTVFVVHPPRATFTLVGDIPVAIDVIDRDAATTRLRTMIDDELDADRSVLLLGDLNTTERERAYSAIASGLRDAHLDAGIGPGNSWRPHRLSFLPLGVIRIDYVLSTRDLVAVSSTVDCALPSDHCRMDATLVRLASP
jgi:vancomycin resistance protein VanJ